MKRLILTIAFAILFAASLQATPARPGKYEFQQPDGSTITLIRYGDEWGHWLTDTQGRVVVRDTDGFYRPAPGITQSHAAAAAKMRRQARMEMLKAPQEYVAIGKKRFLVILVEFSDLSFKVQDPSSAFHRLLNENGYSENGASGSARDYYYENSHGLFEPVFDVYGPVKLPRKKSYYGENDDQGDDKRPADAVADGCKALDDQINFADYDLNGDGTVDLVFMYYAGYGEADSNDDDAIWPHQWSLAYAGWNLRLDGVRVTSYACSNELNGTGTLRNKLTTISSACHEFAHAMGLPDFYDTDYVSNGYCPALFTFSLMSDGTYNDEGRTPPYLSILERRMLGWLDESAVRSFTRSGPVTIPSVDNNVAYMSPSDTEGEYFMYECRTPEGWDRHTGAHGLIVYHVDKSKRQIKYEGYNVTPYALWEYWESYNAINAVGSHPCYYIVPSADPGNLLYGCFKYGEYYYFDYSKVAGIPFPGSKKVTSFVPVGWSGAETGYSFSDIAFTSGTVTMNVTTPVRPSLDYATISNPGNGSYRSGTAFGLVLDDCESDPTAAVEWTFDGLPVTEPSITLTSGAHTVGALVTAQSGTQYALTLEIEVR